MYTKKKLKGIPTVDVALVVIRVGTEENGIEYAIETANKIMIEVQTETQDALKLVHDGRTLSQKPPVVTVTGNQITLTDNVFIPEVAQILQGGTITQDSEGLSIYTPPVAGSTEKGKIFELDAYAKVYDASGQIEMYEQVTYPNCQGTPFGESMEMNVFKVSEYVINSAPKTGESPYKKKYLKVLPDFTETPSPAEANVMSMNETLPSKQLKK